MYRKAPNIKNKITPSKLKSHPIKSKPHLCLLPLHGMIQCKKALCKMCSFVQHGQKQFTTKGKTFNISEFYNCSSVAYYLRCPCHQLYVSRTICSLQQRFGQHRKKVEEGKDKHSVHRHFSKYHKGSTNGLQIWIVEQMPKILTEAERFYKLCEREAYWIYSLNTVLAITSLCPLSWRKECTC